MDSTVEGIVIKAQDYKDNDKLITLFTLEEGKLNAVMKGIKKKNARMKYAAQFFCYGEFELIRKNSYPIVCGCSQKESFFNITKNIESYYGAMIANEILYEFAIEQNEYKLYLFEVLKLFTVLNNEDTEAKIAVSMFLMKIAAISGYALPNIEELSNIEFSSEVRNYYNKLNNSNYIDIINDKVSINAQNVVLKLLNNYYSDNLMLLKNLTQLINL